VHWAFCCGCSAIETGNHARGTGFVFSCSPARRQGATASYELIGAAQIGQWGPDDYDVIDTAGRDIGRIFYAGAGVPADYPWMWTIMGAVVAPRLPSHGFCASLDEAKAQFAKTWRAWLAFNGGQGRQPQSRAISASLTWMPW
jgi:hypothetical protein